MGNAVSFRLNPKCESDRKILAWLEEKSSQPGYQNQTELIKQALLNAMESEQSGIREKEITEWMEQAIKSMAEEFTKVVQESSQNVANNMFAGVQGAMASMQMSGVVPNGRAVDVPNAITTPGMVPVSEPIVPDNELVEDTSNAMDSATKNMLGSLFDMDDLLDGQIPVIKETASFSEQLKNMEHLDDVDSMWEDIKQSKQNFVTLENHLQNIESDILQIENHLEKIDSFVAIMEVYTHLQDIDNMWDDIEICKKNIEKINEDIQTQQSELDILATTSEKHTKSIAGLSEKLADAQEYATDSRKLITKLEAFRGKVSALNHLMEVDEIWKQTEGHQIRINRVEQEGKVHGDKLNELEQADSKMCERITSNAHEISLLKKYMDKLSGISHLDDIDGMWNDIEEHTSKFIESEKRDAELTDTIQKNKEEVNENIAQAVQEAHIAIETLTKKVKYAYWIAGGSAGLAIVELILLLMKVI